MIIKRAAHGRHLLKTGALPEAKPVLAARRRPPGRRRAPYFSIGSLFFRLVLPVLGIYIIINIPC